MKTSLDRLERRIVGIVPLALLAISALLDAALDGADPVTLAIVAAVAVWLPLRRRVDARVYFVLLVAGSAALVARTPLYGFYVWSNYLALVELPQRWMPAGVLAVAAVAAGSQAGGFPGDWAVYLVVVGSIFLRGVRHGKPAAKKVPVAAAPVTT